MPDYQAAEALPGWPTEPEFVSPRTQQYAAPILPPGYVSAIGPDGSLIAVPVGQPQQVPATFAPGPAPVQDVWPKRFLAATPLVGVSGAAGYFLLHALAAAEGSLIAMAVLVAMAWAASGKSGGATSVHIQNRNEVNVHVHGRKGWFK